MAIVYFKEHGMEPESRRNKGITETLQGKPTN
jgi:hypothetical protein